MNTGCPRRSTRPLLGSISPAARIMPCAKSMTAAAVLRCKDQVMRDVESMQENCSDILADAKAINEAKAAEREAAYIEDAAKV